jgi:hypothetical protein
MISFIDFDLIDLKDLIQDLLIIIILVNYLEIHIKNYPNPNPNCLK